MHSKAGLAVHGFDVVIWLWFREETVTVAVPRLWCPWLWVSRTCVMHAKGLFERVWPLTVPLWLLPSILAPPNQHQNVDPAHGTLCVVTIADANL